MKLYKSEPVILGLAFYIIFKTDQLQLNQDWR